MPELPLAGDEFAGYLLRSVLGRGGMSVVYQAENPSLGNIVALKVLAPELAADDIFRTRFLEESRIAASMDHPHVIPIYDIGSSDGLLYIAMRCVSGSDLRQMIAERGRLQPEAAVFLLSQAAQALDAAHRMGLVHRDVKPGNLLIERGNDDDPEHLYLADFGIYQRGMTRTGLTSTQQSLGTVGYAAPEQISGLSVYGSADQYSLGCVLYECLTGRVPFEKGQDAATIWGHAEEHPTRPTLLRPGLPPAVDEVFARVLAKQPGDRYNTCREFMQAASVALGDMATTPPSSSGSPTLQPEPARAGYPATAAPAGYPAAPMTGSSQAEVAPALADYPWELTYEAAEPPAGLPTEQSMFFAAQPARPPQDSTLTSHRQAADEPPGRAGDSGGEQSAGGPGPRSDRLRRGWLVVAAALLLVCAGVGVGAYAALSRSQASQPKATRPTSSAMAMASPTQERAPSSPLMQVLTAADTSRVAMGLLPPSSCKQQGTTTVICTAPQPGIASATFTTYPTLAALYSAYEAKVASLNSRHYRQNVKDCGFAAPSPYGEIAWNHQEQHSRAFTVKEMITGKVPVQTAMGRIACMMTASHSEDIVWTTDYGKMLGVVIGTGTHTAVWYWWADVHHNIVFPGTPMNMSGKVPLMSGAPTP